MIVISKVLLFLNKMKKYLSFFSLIIWSFLAKTVQAVSTTNLNNPLGDITTPQVLIGKIINSALGIVGSITLLMFVYGGFIWMTSSGSSDKIKKGKDIILWSAIGLVVIFSSYALVAVVIKSVK